MLVTLLLSSLLWWYYLCVSYVHAGKIIKSTKTLVTTQRVKEAHHAITLPISNSTFPPRPRPDLKVWSPLVCLCVSVCPLFVLFFPFFLQAHFYFRNRRNRQALIHHIHIYTPTFTAQHPPPHLSKNTATSTDTAATRHTFFFVAD